MREIKFRAWDQGNSIGTGIMSYDTRYDCDADSIMQYTGLKDKNGVEIYEEHELNNQYGVRFEEGAYILYNISTGDRFQQLNQVVINGYGLEITREYTQVEKD